MAKSLRSIRGVLRTLQTVWSIAGLTLIAILLSELGLRLVFAIKDHLSAAEVPDRRVLAEGYGGESWPVQHFRELEQLRDRWEPYVYFRQRPFAGQTITIEPDGRRRTWQPPLPRATRRGPSKLLMLGGSSLWGFGARDDRTIPSLVARKLHERDCRVEVRNLAEIGYVSTQEVVAMVRELQVGYRPDLVIFYDGVNDSTSALLEGEAGVTTNERNRRDEFNIRQSPARLAGALIASLIRDSASFRLARIIGRRLAADRGTARGMPGDNRRRELIAEVVRRYQANLSTVDRLGREFGFEALYFWQPVVFDRMHPTSFEREEAERYAWAREFVVGVYEAVRSSSTLAADPHFHDLSRLFADATELVFIDYCHTTEAANDRIAEAIARRCSRSFARLRAVATRSRGR